MSTVRMLVKGIVPFVFVCSVLLVSPAVAGEPPRYTITEIGPLPGEEDAQAFGINEAGDVVGFSSTTIGFPDCCLTTGTAFLFSDGELSDLGPLNGLDTRAEAINNLGQVAGWADEAFPRAFLWQNGEIQDIGTLGGHPFSKAFDINDAGQVVGWSYPPDTNDRHIFLWQDGAMLDLGFVSNTGPPEFGINNLGQVVGGGFIWEDGVRTTIAMRAYDINDLSQVVGYGVGGAVLWENGTFQQLGGSVAYAINNRSQVVGVADGASLWHDGVMHTLSDLVTLPPDWLLRSAWDINDTGQIVGNASTPDGITHAFLMTPVDADFDDDDDTDLMDFAAFRSCLTGPGVLRSSECRLRDIDRDGHVDLKDFQALQWVFTGP
ncbi:MAG: hypothetical protein JSU86_03460 [Phycisphaerales bacterium]|nr:MAG: hypothetical protein JSU86_03460 [Phycisphaerales bacterium]